MSTLTEKPLYMRMYETLESLEGKITPAQHAILLEGTKSLYEAYEALPRAILLSRFTALEKDFRLLQARLDALEGKPDPNPNP